MKITLLYIRFLTTIRVKKQRNIKSLDQQNDLVISGFCYIRPLYNEVPLYCLHKKSQLMQDFDHPPPPPTPRNRFSPTRNRVFRRRFQVVSWCLGWECCTLFKRLMKIHSANTWSSCIIYYCFNFQGSCTIHQNSQMTYSNIMSGQVHHRLCFYVKSLSLICLVNCLFW